jgi:hypothetical protein
MYNQPNIVDRDRTGLVWLEITTFGTYFHLLLWEQYN